MPAPTLIAYAESSWSTTGTSKSAAAVSWLAGDLVVIVSSSEDAITVVSVANQFGLTLTHDGAVGTSAATCGGDSWHAVASSDQASVAVAATASDGTHAYGIGVWVFRGHGGTGARATGITAAKTVSLTRAGSNSLVVEAIGDFSAAVTTSYSFTPAVGNDRQHQQVAGRYTVYAADWGDQGTAGTTSYGTSGEASTGPFTKVALEVKGLPAAGGIVPESYAPGWHPGAGLPGLPRRPPFWVPFPAGTVIISAGPQAGPPVYPLGHPVQARQPAPPRGRSAGRDGIYAQSGPPVKPADSPVRAPVPAPRRGGTVTSRDGAYSQAGPPVRPLRGPVAARVRVLPPRGRVSSRGGAYAGSGPPVPALHGPVQARRLPARGGGAEGRAGTFTAVGVVSGPPVYPLHGPVQARRLPQRGGSTSRRTGIYAQAGAPVRALPGPVQARPPLPPRGRTGSRAGTFTLVVTGSGPPVYSLGHPVQARRQPALGGRVIRRAGTYAGSGPPVKPLQQPIGIFRRQPPPPARGRTASRRGPYAQAGPPVIRLRRPVRGQPAVPLLTGRADWRAGTWTAPTVVPVVFGRGTATGQALTAVPGTVAGASGLVTAADGAAADPGTGGGAAGIATAPPGATGVLGGQP